MTASFYTLINGFCFESSSTTKTSIIGKNFDSQQEVSVLLFSWANLCVSMNHINLTQFVYYTVCTYLTGILSFVHLPYGTVRTYE